MSNEKVNSFVKMVIEENLVDAQVTLKEYLNEKLTGILQEKYEEYAPTLFEEVDAKKADKNKDGELSSWEIASSKWAEGNTDETTGSDGSEEEEEGDTEDEDGEEDGEEAEEDEEDGEDDEDQE
jgi:hypothetical protein